MGLRHVLSDRGVFLSLDKPALKPLPTVRYEYAEWKAVRVNIDYHVEVDQHYYSVPFPLVRELLDARIAATTVELFHKGVRVASHIRSFEKGKHTTVREHMPKAHQEHLEWTPSRLIEWGRKMGESTAALVAKILDERPHPEQGYRSCLGLLRLGKKYSAERLEAACARALHFGTHKYRSVKSILQSGLDREPYPTQSPPSPPLPDHANVRGADYYQ